MTAQQFCACFNMKGKAMFLRCLTITLLLPMSPAVAATVFCPGNPEVGEYNDFHLEVDKKILRKPAAYVLQYQDQRGWWTSLESVPGVGFPDPGNTLDWNMGMKKLKYPNCIRITGGLVIVPEGQKPNPNYATVTSVWFTKDKTKIPGNPYVDTDGDGKDPEKWVDYKKVTIQMVVPEVYTWAMMVAGFGLVGTALRRRQAAMA